MIEERASGVKPANYGEWWNTNTKDVAWYQEIHDARAPIHDAFIRWMADRERSDGPIRSVLEIGCGRGVRYPALFADRRYVGYDISRKEIEWCRANRDNPRHEYIFGDFIADGTGERFDLVFAHAVIDHVYDIDAFLRAALTASNRWLYFTAYRGWFPDLGDHRYSWSDADTCFYNDLSPSRLQAFLTELGCRAVQVSPSEAIIEPFGRETLIVAERPSLDAVRKADITWLQAAAACPACLEGGILNERREHPAGVHYRCAGCHRVYPVDRLGRIDFQVHDRLASLPAGALEMWALARHGALREPRRGTFAFGAADRAARRFGDLVDIEGRRVLDVGWGGVLPPAYVEDRHPEQFVALGPAAGDRETSHSTTLAWPELMPFGAETFDSIVCDRSLEQILCFESSLREFHRVLRPGGGLCVRALLVPDAAQHSIFPPLFPRMDGQPLPETEAFERRAAALDEVAHRVGDVHRFESEYGHLLADRTHVRRLSLRTLKTIATYGFRPETIEIWDHESDDGRPVLDAFIRFCKRDPATEIDRGVLQHIDLLTVVADLADDTAQNVRSLEHVLNELDRVRRSVTEVRFELSALRHAVDSPRTPFERIYRRLSRLWRGKPPSSG